MSAKNIVSQTEMRWRWLQVAGGRCRVPLDGWESPYLSDTFSSAEEAIAALDNITNPIYRKDLVLVLCTGDTYEFSA